MFNQSYCGNNDNKNIKNSKDIVSFLSSSKIPTGEVVYDNMDGLNLVINRGHLGQMDWVAHCTKIDQFFGEKVEPKSMSIADVRRAMEMEKIQEWQKIFIKQLEKTNVLKRVYIFKDYGLEKVRAIAKDPIDDMEQLSKIYIDYIREHPEHYFNFLVFGENEINEFSLPDDRVIIDFEE